jgi:F-box/WD-40 domain protein 7
MIGKSMSNLKKIIIISLGRNKHHSAVTCLQFNNRFVITSSDDGTVKLWDVKTGEFIRNLVALDSGGSGGVVWRIRYVFN